MLRRLLSVVLAGALAAPATASADDYFKEAPSSTTVAVRQARSRTPAQRITIYGLLGGAAIFAGVGVWAHIDSYDIKKELEIAAVEPVETWTQDRQDLYDRGVRQRGLAVVSYVVSALFFTGATVYAYRTRPGYETILIEPTKGGATVSGTWTW
jgi:hypothetical protein